MSNDVSSLITIHIDRIETLCAHVKKLLELYPKKHDDSYLKQVYAALIDIESGARYPQKFILPEGVEEFEFLDDHVGDSPSGKHGGKNLGTIRVPDGGISELGTLQLPDEDIS